MESLYKSASLILDQAQPNWDGGIFPVIIQSLFPSNNSKTTSPKDHVLQTLTSNGYLTGLVCGIIWIILLIFGSIFFCVMHCRRKKETKANLAFKMMARRIEKTKRDWSPHWACLAAQFIILFVLIILIFVAAVLCIVSTHHLYTALSGSSDSSSTGIFPRTSRAITGIKTYLEKFADRSQEDSRPVLDEIIYATEVMQNKTMKRFNKLLFKKLGVEDTFRLGNIMVDRMLQRFKLAREIVKHTTTLFDQLTLLSKITDSIMFFCVNYDCRGNVTCDSDLNKLKSFNLLNKNTVNALNNFRTNSANGFLYALKTQNQSEESIQEEMAYGKRKSDEMIAKMYIRMKVVLDIPGSIRNMTNEIWAKSSKDLMHQAEQIQNVSILIDTTVQPKVASYGSFVLIPCIIVFLILIGSVCFTSPIVIHNYCILGDLSDVRRNKVKVLLYTQMFFLMFIVLFAMLFFLFGGYLRTEVCRYTAQKQQLFGSNNSLMLDVVVDNFLNENWAGIQKSLPPMDIPLPQPNNVLSGVLNECRLNKGLFEALHGVKAIDPAVLNKPELAERFVRLGRQLMVDQLNETDPREMMPAGMKENLQLAKNVDKMTRNQETQDFHEQLQNPIFVDDFRIISKAYRTFVEKNPNNKMSKNVMKNINDMEVNVKKINSTMSQLKRIPLEFYNLEPVKPIVLELISSLEIMTETMLDKSNLLKMANALYQEHIADTTPEQAAKVMNKFGHKMISKIGRCRPIYEAYVQVQQALCTDVSYPIGGIWFSMGMGVLLATPLIILVMAMITKKYSPSIASLRVPIGVDQVTNGAKDDVLETVEMLPVNGEA